MKKSSVSSQVVVKKPNSTNATISIRSKKYAALAYPLVAEIQDMDIKAKYRTLALNLPSMIMQSGLAQAVGFLMAKGGAEHLKLLDDLVVVLGHEAGNNGADKQDKRNSLHQAILKANITEYQLLTRNAIEGASWLKRYTQALLG